jgi:hypothetical protein
MSHSILEALIAELRRRIKALEEALGALANAADNVGIAFFDSDDMPPEVDAMQSATQAARAVLKEATR